MPNRDAIVGCGVATAGHHPAPSGFAPRPIARSVSQISATRLNFILGTEEEEHSGKAPGHPLALAGLGTTLAGAIIGAIIGYQSGKPSADCSDFWACGDYSEVGAIIGGVIGVVIGACVGAVSVLAILVIRDVRRHKGEPS